MRYPTVEKGGSGRHLNGIFEALEDVTAALLQQEASRVQRSQAWQQGSLHVAHACLVAARSVAAVQQTAATLGSSKPEHTLSCSPTPSAFVVRTILSPSLPLSVPSTTVAIFITESECPLSSIEPCVTIEGLQQARDYHTR